LVDDLVHNPVLVRATVPLGEGVSETRRPFRSYYHINSAPVVDGLGATEGRST